MPGKTVPLSVRITQEDSDFLAGLGIPGAVTPSDKIRALIGEARRRRAGLENYGDGLAFMQGLLAPEGRSLREAENVHQTRSDLMTLILNWLPETTAYLLAEVRQEYEEPPSMEELVAIEAGLADRVVALAETLLRLALTRRNPCYDDQAVSRRVAPILELSVLIKSATITEGGSS